MKNIVFFASFLTHWLHHEFIYGLMRDFRLRIAYGLMHRLLWHKFSEPVYNSQEKVANGEKSKE